MSGVELVGEVTEGNAYSPFTWMFDLKIVTMYFSQRLKTLLCRLLSV